MIKARLKDKNGRPVYFLGLSDENVEKLKLGMPIAFPTHEIGIGGDGTLVIHYGETEHALEEELRTLVTGKGKTDG